MSRGFNGGHGRGWEYSPQRGEASGGGPGAYGREGGESNEPRFHSEKMERGESALLPKIFFLDGDELLRDSDELSVEFVLDWEMKKEPFRPSNNVPNTDVTWRRQSTTIGQPWTMDNAACSIADDAPTDVEEETTWGDTLEADELNDLDGHVDDANQYPEFSTIPLDDEHANALFGSSALAKDWFIDESLADDLKCKQASPQVQELLEFRKKLPAFQRKDEFVELVKNNRVVVVSGLTGCGKSTQLPQAVLDDQIKRGDGSRTYLVCTQPRWISAISLAERVASERGENLNIPGLNRSVGYQTRHECRLPRDEGSLLYCTTEMVLRWWSSGAALECASHLFLDEIHERDVESDLLLILIRDLLKQRLDLRAYNGWSECAPGDEARKFAKDNFLSTATLEHISKLRHEFAELLQAVGFVSSSDPMDEHVNSNSVEPAIIEAVIALGLYPNVAFAKDQTDIPRQIGGSYTPDLELKNGRSVEIHPSSVNKDVRYFPTRYLAFKVAMKTSANFLRDCSTVSPLALCIAASQMQKNSLFDRRGYNYIGRLDLL